jgi:hypothetical protein
VSDSLDSIKVIRFYGLLNQGVVDGQFSSHIRTGLMSAFSGHRLSETVDFDSLRDLAPQNQPFLTIFSSFDLQSVNNSIIYVTDNIDLTGQVLPSVTNYLEVMGNCPDGCCWIDAHQLSQVKAHDCRNQTMLIEGLLSEVESRSHARRDISLVLSNRSTFGVCANINAFPESWKRQDFNVECLEILEMSLHSLKMLQEEFHIFCWEYPC